MRCVRGYPVDMSSFLRLGKDSFEAGVPYEVNGGGYDAMTITRYALACWNEYVATDSEYYRGAFLWQVRWLVEHEVRIGEDGGGWPIAFPHAYIHTSGSWLSALAQGCALSVLVRAYGLTRERVLLEVARRVVRTFERDVLDGGVSAPIGEQGIFFEEVAVYPAAHVLSGFLFGLLGVYDYVGCTDDGEIGELMRRGVATLRALLAEFDVGFWTYSDLLHRRLASPADLAVQVELLEAVARCCGDDYCGQVCIRWRGYQRRLGCRVRYAVNSRWAGCGRALLKMIQRMLFPRRVRSEAGKRLRVCISLPAFLVTGGIQTVLDGIGQVTEDRWECEYVTQYVGRQGREGYVIRQFGKERMTPWLFPGVWLYVVAGLYRLMRLLRDGADYDVILTQDAVFTGAFSGLVGRLAGVRVVCIDHGDLTTLRDKTFHTERMGSVMRKGWSSALRFVMVRLLVFYWPSLWLLARFSARWVDHFLVPGVVGDGVEEACKKLRIAASRVTRYGSMVDVGCYSPVDGARRADLRAERGIAADAVVVAMVCRLAPEKGIDVGLEGMRRALLALSPEARSRVRVIIGGDGPLRRQVEEDIDRCGLGEVCEMWGDLSAEEVIGLLNMSDVFLYTSLRGACYSMAILEAMAAGCAVVASTRPISNARLLDGGRGIAVSAGDVEETSQALVRLLSDVGLCQRMGRLAREYVDAHHRPAVFRRELLRATYWSGLDEILDKRGVDLED